MTFQLDTSGSVGEMPAWKTPVPTCNRFMRWENLSPFTQGYAEALFASRIGGEDGSCLNWSDLKVGFSDIAPETLEKIIADCDARIVESDLPPSVINDQCKHGGKWFFEARQNRALPHFPPLTVQLGEDGKVRFAE